MELLGSGYVIDHCISAFSERQETRAYQIYVTDALKVIGQNTSGAGHNSEMSKRWIDIIEEMHSTPVEIDEQAAEVKADDIINDFKKRLNRKEVE